MDNSSPLQSIILLISAKTGIKIRAQDEPNLRQKIDKRIKALGLKNEQEYLTLLGSSVSASGAEWHKLITLITTGESYFFRDRGQIELLKHHLLPDLITAKQETKTLNILSAGCSTGEEVYSLAICVQELIGRENWHLNLVGVDLNQEAITKAKRGIFPEWSFRGVEPQYRSLYFRPNPEGWEIAQSLKQRVKFYQCNLVEDAIPIGASVDLIICRNVFIYFDSETIALVLAKFIDLLAVGGYLLTGHTELQGQDLAPLIPISYPESLVYQMPAPNLNRESVFVPPDYKELGEQALATGRYKEAIDYLQNSIHPPDEQAILLMAKAYANQGNYPETERLCGQILSANHYSIAALQLLAQIAEEQNQKETAKEYLRRILFLDPNFTPAYFDLIDLHLSDREQEQAKTLFLTLANMRQFFQGLEYELRLESIKKLLDNLSQEKC